MVFQIGDKVFLEDSAQVDTGWLSWQSHIHDHRSGVVKSVMASAGQSDKPIPENERIYAVEWQEDFSGGHDCQRSCLPHRGQFITAKHLSLKFEASRVVQTIPNIDSIQC
jgi:hypothetical protein